MGRADVDLYGVFDGHSGHTASRFCAEHFPDCLEALWDEANLHKALVDSLKLVNERLRTHIESDGGDDRCGSTAVVALFVKNRLYVANLGDSRAVLCDAGKAQPMSEDHKPSRDAERVRQLGGYISGVTGKGDTERINGQLAVARGLGDFYMQPFLSDEAEVEATDLRPSHQFLILACDGVWDEVDNQQACDVVLAEQNPWRGSSRLISFAYQAGSDDNISAIVVDLRRTGLASAGPQAPAVKAPKKSGSFLKSLKDPPPKKEVGSPPATVPLKRVPVGGATTKKVPVGRAKVCSPHLTSPHQVPPAKTPPPGIKDAKKVPARPPPGKLVPKSGPKPIIPKLSS